MGVFFYYMLLLIAVIGTAISFCISKLYQLKVEATFEAILAKCVVTFLLTALMFLAFNGFRVSFTPFTVTVAAVMSVIGTASAVVCFKGYANGSIAVFTLFQMTGGMILPFIFGLFYGNELTVCRVIGIVLMLVSLALPVFGGGRKEPGKRFGRLFIILCVAVFFINGSISIGSYIHSNSVFGISAGTNSFLVIYPSISFVLTSVLYIAVRTVNRRRAKRGETVKTAKLDLKKTAVLGLLIAAMTAVDGIGYYLQLVSAGKLPAVALYPMVTGGVVVFTAIAGRVFFGEKLSKSAVAGVIITALATVLFMF